MRQSLDVQWLLGDGQPPVRPRAARLQAAGRRLTQRTLAGWLLVDETGAEGERLMIRLLDSRQSPAAC